MSLFSLGRQPRRFNHVPIFYDEHADRLRALKQKTQARLEQGEHEEPENDSAREFSSEDLHGIFLQETTHLRRHKEHAGLWITSMGALLLLILVLFLAAFLLIA